MVDQSLISVVLPAYDQADHIGAVVETIHETLTKTGWRFELILVPNGPDLRTHDACQVLAKTWPGVRCVSSNEAGWGKAVGLGLKHAQGDLLCYTNSARTAADDLVRILQVARSLPDSLVKATRRTRESLLRRFGSILYNFECRMLFDISCWDINGTPKVFPRALAEPLRTDEPGDLYDLKLLIAAAKHAVPIAEIPVISTSRHGGVSTTGVLRAFQLYLRALLTWFSSQSKQS